MSVCQVAKRGQVLKVKVLGTVALIDEGKYLSAKRAHRSLSLSLSLSLTHRLVTGETDWKIIVIDVDDPLADQMNGKNRS